MSRSEVKKSRNNRVSVINWIGTLLLSVLPGVNIIAWILMIIFAKRQAKRSFAIAALILTVLCVVLYFVAFIVFGDQLVEFAQTLTETAPAIEPTVAPLP